MILWNGADEHQEFLDIHRRDHAIENPVRVKIVSHLNSRVIQAFDYLSNSVGACFGDWKSYSDEGRAAYILHLFNRLVTKDRLTTEEVHKAFLEIEEYAEFHDSAAGEESRFSNPFWKLYWEPIKESVA